jgi:hypothetical protein
VVVFTVIVEVADEPGATAAGVEAASVNADSVTIGEVDPEVVPVDET